MDVALLTVAAVWGSSYLAAKAVATPDTVFAFLAIRFALAAVGLTIVLTPRLRHISRAELVAGSLFGLILSLVFILETFGLTRTSASHAGVLISLTIILTPALQQWMQRTPRPPAFYGAAVTAVAGVGVMTQDGGLTAPNVGDLLILLAAGARAVHVTVIARWSENRILDPARVTVVQFGIGLSIFTLLAPCTGRGVGEVAVHLTYADWILASYLALICTVFAFFVQIWAVQRTSPARVGLFLGTEPLWAAAIGVLIAGDQLTFALAVGASLVLLGSNWGRAIEARVAGGRAP